MSDNRGVKHGMFREHPGRWFVRVTPHDGARETAIEMWHFLQYMGVKKESVEPIDDHSFKVWVEDREVGALMKAALEERYGK